MNILKKGLVSILIIVMIQMITLISSEDFGYDNPNLPKLEASITTTSTTTTIINYSTLNVSTANYSSYANFSYFSDCWVTDEGIKCNVSDITYDEISGGDVNDLGYTGTFSFLAGQVGGIDMTGNPWYLSGTDLEIADELTVDGYSHLNNTYPKATLTYDLGSGALRWRTLFVQNISAEEIDTYNLDVLYNLTVGGFINGVNLSNISTSNNSNYLNGLNSTDFWIVGTDQNVSGGNKKFLGVFIDQSNNLNWNPNSRAIYGLANVYAIDYQNRLLVDSSGHDSVKWNTRQLVNNASSLIFDWNNGLFYDSRGYSASGGIIDINGNILRDRNWDITINWTSRNLYSNWTIPNVCYSNGTNCNTANSSYLTSMNYTNITMLNQNNNGNITLNGNIYSNGTGEFDLGLYSSYNPLSSFTTYPTTAARNDFTGTVGYQFYTLKSEIITHLGRLYVSGNTQDHYVAIWEVGVAGAPVASGTVLASSPSDANGFKWVKLSSPVTLQSVYASKQYRIVVDETNGGDTWKDTWTPKLDARLTVQGACYETTQGAYPANIDYGNIIYDTPALKFTGDTLQLNTDSVGDGAILGPYGSGWGAMFFNNVNAALQNPALGIAGYNDLNGDFKVVAAIYVDRFGRLIFGGDPAPGLTVFSTSLETDNTVVLGPNDAFGLTRGSAMGVSDYGIMFAYQKNAIRFTTDAAKYTEMGSTAFTDPHFFVHSATSNSTNGLWVSMFHDGINAHIDSGTGITLNVSGNNTVKITNLSGWGTIEAGQYITHTSVFDKSKGSALDKIQDASYYLDDKGKIDDTKFYGVTSRSVTDMSKPVYVNIIDANCTLSGLNCTNYTRSIITYPYTKEETGVDLGSEIDVLRQAVHELKIENERIKDCVKYSDDFKKYKECVLK